MDRIKAMKFGSLSKESVGGVEKKAWDGTQSYARESYCKGQGKVIWNLINNHKFSSSWYVSQNVLFYTY